MMARRRRTLAALCLLTAVAVAVPVFAHRGPDRAVAATGADGASAPGDHGANASAALYNSALPSSVPPGAAAAGVASAELAQPAQAPKSATWIQPPGATIHCPVTVVACVDLKAKLTWIQHDGVITLGPVRMQPGEGAKRTPTGTFTINRKAAVYFSHTYGGAMPYSVFFGHAGIAFHEGTLTGFSHGCIHLTMANAKKFFAALHAGERVYVA